ncbi:MAG TPA: hypothetical protein VFI11_12080 [Anaerolineales bacterium]|nr:hypothetical protein [Anaerolineales bacterium]
MSYRFRVSARLTLSAPKRLASSLAVFGLLSLACGGAANLTATVSLPASTIAPSPTRAPTTILFVVEGVPANAAEAARTWAAESGLSVADGTQDELMASIQQGGRAYVLAAGDTSWLSGIDAESELRAVVIDPEGALSQPGVSTMGGAAVRWDQAGFLAGVVAGHTADSGAVGWLTDESQAAPGFNQGFEQGLAYACPRCRLVHQAQAGFDGSAFASQGVDVVALTPGSGAAEAAARAAEIGLWFAWVGGLPEGLAPDRLAGQIRFAPEALVVQAFQALADGQGGQTWSYSVESGSLLLADLNDQAISPGKQRLAQEAWDKLARGELQVLTQE